MKKALQVILKGRVQGVGFRWFTREQAREFGVNGYVKNLPNGDVEVVAEGEVAVVDAFIEKLKQGPGFAHVTDTEMTELQKTDRYSSFDVAL
ncbi:MAG: acylphosphatase [Caldithrix sp.]|nr:acylphosphatase [Caldithrix sp.]